MQFPFPETLGGQNTGAATVRILLYIYPVPGKGGLYLILRGSVEKLDTFKKTGKELLKRVTVSGINVSMCAILTARQCVSSISFIASKVMHSLFFVCVSRPIQY